MDEILAKFPVLKPNLERYREDFLSIAEAIHGCSHHRVALKKALVLIAFDRIGKIIFKFINLIAVYVCFHQKVVQSHSV